MSYFDFPSSYSPSPSPEPGHPNEPPNSCQCATCCDPDQEVTECPSNPTESSGGNTVHLNSGNFAFRAPWLGLNHLSGVTEGADVPLFESKGQARVVVLDDKGGSDPDLFDVGVVVGKHNTVRYRFRQKAGDTVYYEDADGVTAVLTKDAAADEFVLRTAHHRASRFYGFGNPGTPAGRLKAAVAADGTRTA